MPLTVCFSSVLAWMGFAVARNKEACPSHPRVLESDRTPAFLLLLLLLLLHYAMLVGPARCFIFYFNSSAKAIWWWMLLYRTLRKVTCTNMREKHVRSVGVYGGIMYGCVRSVGVCSGIMYGCARYVLRVARVDSGWGYCSCRNDEKKVVFGCPASSCSACKLRRGPLKDDE